MKILAIRGKNIASLEGDFSIDFTTDPLLSTGIFAISGPTGAGKSTLLDTMCLALFARTPRTSQAKENKIYVKDVNEDVLVQGDPRFLLRRGTPSGYAEVDFLGLTGYSYRVRWSVGRAREKEDGRLQNYRVTLFNLDKEQEEQGSRSDIQNRVIELIGLTFEQFTRSVLLAQNDFSTFLKAEQGEKASLLEKLTGTEHYSRISRLVFEKTGEAKSRYEQVYSKIQGIELLPEEVEKELRDNLEENEKEQNRLAGLRSFRQELMDQVQTSSKLIEVKKGQQKEVLTRQEGLLTHLVEVNKQIEKEKTGLQKAEEDAKRLMPEIRQATKLDIEIRSFTPILEEAKTQWQKEESNKTQQAIQLEQLEQKLRQKEKEKTGLHEWFIKYRDKEKVANQIEALLIHIDNAFSVKKQLQESEEKKKRFLSGKREQQAGLEKVQSALREKEDLHQTTESKLKEQLEKQKQISREQIEQELTDSRKKREELLLEQARFVTTGDIRALRDKLAEGEPCPVCGSCEHPYASPDIYREMEERNKQIALLTVHLEKLDRVLLDYQRLQTDINHLQQQLVLQEKELSQWKQQVMELVNRGKVYTGQLENEQQIIKDLEGRLTCSLQGTSALFGNDEWQVNWLNDPLKFRDTLVTFAETWLQKKEQLLQTERETESLRSAVEFKKEQALKEEIILKEIFQKFQEKQQIYDQLLKDRSLLLEGKTAQQVEDELNQAIEQHRNQMELLQSTAKEQAALVDQTKGVTSQIIKELEVAEKELEERSRNLQNWIETNNTLPEGLTIDQTLERLTKQKTDWSFRLRTHAENLKKVEGFQKELNRCREKYEQWAKLNELVGSADGGKFRRIAQGYTLDVLINYANVQLKSLTHRYRLERVPETLALQVIDRDMCDEVRTVHSLSGGESFLVSLALALGLSSLSSNRMKVESLFIDEGFGSLDSDTLRIALDALESLRTQGRKIGVISHVQEMTERIPVQVKVCRSGNGRSYLEII